MSGVREDGWYWVKFDGKWRVAEWCDVSWFLGDLDLDDVNMDDIGSRIEKTRRTK